MEKICREHDLLIEEDNVVRLPFLVKGQLVVPPEISHAQIEAAFAGLDPGVQYVRLPEAQLIRLPKIDHPGRSYQGTFLYQVLPAVNPLELVERDFDKLAVELYSLPVAEIWTYLEKLSEHLQANWAAINNLRQVYEQISELPPAYLEQAFATLRFALDASAARRLVDRELSIWEKPGSQFLDGWVDLPAESFPGIVARLAENLPGSPEKWHWPANFSLRAMPTRQLHITAGNAPEIPLVSALRLLQTKSAGVIKAPLEAIMPAALLVLAAVSAQPDHPLTKNLSVVYWPGGDETIESYLLNPAAFDRIVVWGAPEAVTSVQSRALFTRVISLNPRYGASLVGQEAFSGNLDLVAFLAARDVMIYNQKACTASHIQYIEGTAEQATLFANHLAHWLQEWDSLAPGFIPPQAQGQVKRMHRGKYASSEWVTNTFQGAYTSGVVVIPGEFDMLDHPMCRLVVIRPVHDLSDALAYLHPGVSTVGVYPELRRMALRDAIASRGVSSILPLGSCETLFLGAPQDGMIILNQLVDWKLS